MAQTYVVQPGDTLSGIGAKFGVPYGQITGYKSGNPNLIYPGETLTIPAGNAAAAAAAAPAAAAPAASSGLPEAPTFKESSEFLGAATSEVAPLYDPQIATMQQSLPLLRQRYDLLLKSITQAGEAGQAEIQKQQTTQLGKVEASAAARGLRGGMVSSERAATADVFNTAIAKLTGQTQLNIEQTGLEEAEKTNELQGLISQLVGQKASKITETARSLALEDLQKRQAAFENLLSLATAAHQREMDEFTKKMEQSKLGLEQQRVNIAAGEATTAKEKEAKATAAVNATATVINDLYSLAQRKGVKVTDLAIENRIRTLVGQYPEYSSDIYDTVARMTGYGSKGGTNPYK